MVPFLALGSRPAAWGLGRLSRIAQRPNPAAEETAPACPVPGAEASWDDVAPVDLLGLEVGYRLIALVDKTRQGDLLSRIKGVRKKFAAEVGFLPPAVHIRDNLELHPSATASCSRAWWWVRARRFAGMYMAINPGHIKVPLAGTATVDPAFGLNATWVDARTREQAQAAGYTVVDAATVIATHLNHVMQSNAAALLGRVEVQDLLDHTRKVAPALVDDTRPEAHRDQHAPEGAAATCWTNRVHIRDLRGILELLAEHAGTTKDNELTPNVRIGLAPPSCRTCTANGARAGRDGGGARAGAGAGAGAGT